MEIVNQEVKHINLGIGTIVKQDDNYITISFSKGDKKFVYPDIFKQFLMATDPSINEIIQNEMKQNELEKERLKKQKSEQEEKAWLRTKLDKEKKSLKSKSHFRASIAFKCNYCDGGSSDNHIGYRGICSDEVIRNNIEIEKRTWCCSDTSSCKKYINHEITRKELDEISEEDESVCYESQMLDKWYAYAGIVQRGVNKGKPMKLHQVQSNSLCVLTTRDPGSGSEKERYIFAAFLVDETYEGDNCDEGYVTTKSKYKIELSPYEAKKLLFWNYHANDNHPEKALWSSGLHRYYEDEQAVQILRDIAEVKKETDDEKLAQEFLTHYCNINDFDLDAVPPAKGALKKNISMMTK